MLDDTVDNIIETTEAEFGLPAGILMEMAHRTHPVSLARHVACYIAHHKTHISWDKISGHFGAADHKMALHGFNRVSLLLRGVGKTEDIEATIKVLRKLAPDLL